MIKIFLSQQRIPRTNITQRNCFGNISYIAFTQTRGKYFRSCIIIGAYEAQTLQKYELCRAEHVLDSCQVQLGHSKIHQDTKQVPCPCCRVLLVSCRICVCATFMPNPLVQSSNLYMIISQLIQEFTITIPTVVMRVLWKFGKFCISLLKLLKTEPRKPLRATSKSC